MDGEMRVSRAVLLFFFFFRPRCFDHSLEVTRLRCQKFNYRDLWIVSCVGLKTNWKGYCDKQVVQFSNISINH